jgi:putative hemolysin
MVYFELALVVALILLNGFLAMSELAVVSARPARLKVLADQGANGSRRALALAANPGKFLSAVQIGITLVGVLSGAFSGATLGARLGTLLAGLGVDNDVAGPLGVAIVIALITYASLIVGELVPKQIALRDPERIALCVAPAMTLLARVASPWVWLLDASGSALLRMLGQKQQGEERITTEELKSVIAQAESAGVLDPDERKMISGVMRLAARPVKGIMTPRCDVDWIDLTAPEGEIASLLKATNHSRLPVGEAIDQLIGVVQAKDLLSSILAGNCLNISEHVRPAPVVPDRAEAMDVLTTLKSADVPLALVHDEYGHFQGIVAPADIMEAIVGAFRADTDDTEPAVIHGPDGSWLLSGHLPADEMADHLGISLPEERDYQTVGGFVLAAVGHLPTAGENCSWRDWRFEVVDVDGHRINKVLVTRVPLTRRLPAAAASVGTR